MKNFETASGFHRPTWCEIDLDAIERNVAQVQGLVGRHVQVFVCLKGNALGCGAEQVALACQRAGAAGFAFGNIDTAIACRGSVQGLPMLLYPSCLPRSAAVLERHGLSPTISTVDDVHGWDRQASTRLDVFLKIDCGGLRAGAFPDDVVATARAIVAASRLRLAGVYGHALASYHIDKTQSPALEMQKQIGIFSSALESMEKAGINVPLRMFSSSEVILSHPSADFDAVEPGRLILGIDFPGTVSRARDWRPALVGLKTTIVVRKDLSNHPPKEAAAFFPIRPGMVIGLLPIGWSDGYPRELPQGATALVKGKRAPLLGPVHSELLRIDLTEVPEAAVGDEVVLLGTSGEEQITLKDLAEQWRVGLSDVFSALGESLPRVYLRASCAQAFKENFER
jgi:alanine racemase